MPYYLELQQDLSKGAEPRQGDIRDKEDYGFYVISKF